MVSHWYVSPEDRQSFEQKKVSANAANTRYYLGTNFARKYDGAPDADCLYEHIIFLLGDNPIVITRGTKLDPNKEKSSGSDNSTLSFVTQSASYDLVDTGITDSLNIGNTIKVHTNYEDNTQPTTFETPWNEDNCVVTFPTDKTPQYLTEAGVAINTIALAGGKDYTLMYLGEDDGTDVWLVLNPNGIEKKELELINGALLTDTQKLAIYRYLAERNATGERVPNSLGIDYVTYHSETIDEVLHIQAVIKYIDSNIKKDIIEAHIENGSLSLVREQIIIDPSSLQPSLTPTQMAAVYSGITSAKVSQYDGYGNDISALMAETFPLVVAYITNDATKTNNGTREYGTTITPKVSWTAKRQGSDVAPSGVTLGTGINWGTLAQDSLSYVGTEQALTSELSFSAQVSQGGQTKNLSQIKWTPSYYRYTIDLGTTKPTTDADILSAIANAANSQGVTQYALSTKSELGDTTLQAGHYYLFAVKGNVTLEAYDAALGGKVECDKGTLQVPLRNGYKESGSNDVKTFLYSYIIVDKGSTTWKFNIQNT